MARHWPSLVAAFVVAALLASPSMADEKKISFKKTHIDPIFRSEGVAVGDFNKDGNNDIAAGYVWYEAPEWKMHVMIDKAPEYDGAKGYSNSFQTFAHDVNGDGWTDVIVIDFPGTNTWWMENPKEPGKQWPKHVLTPCTNNESPQFTDVDGDGKPDFLLAFSDPKNVDGPEKQVGYAKPDSDPLAPWKLYPVSEKNAPGANRYSHGIGTGDINKDGRNDILVVQGWWEAPAESGESGAWKFHGANFDCSGGGAAQMFVYDFDEDGDNDVLASSPHGIGIYWFEQTEPNKWQRHEIDSEYSQTHAVEFKDINGDGKPEIITGKRWWAHGPSGDAQPNAPAVLYWYEFSVKDGKVKFDRHQIDHDSGVGTQFEVADVNGDKLPDIVISNKKGTYYFEQVRE